MALFDKLFSNENNDSAGKKDFLAAVEERRSYYAISKDPVGPDDRIKEVVEHAVKHTPSSFNSQSARVVVLLGEQHSKLWSTITTEALRKVVPSGQFSPTEEKLEGFANGYGTVLYFEDQAVIESLQQQYPLYRENFHTWSEQSSGMLQFVIWTALELEGYGASLQHYNPLIDEAVQKEWKLPAGWKLIAQMPFGKPVSPPGPKEFKPLGERVQFHK
ncbi:nitroreductase family protein [Metabacillus sp. 84]|uniref:nitroreductase family protein n=1 Tax=unclassified Metabacillus TaxID=2675274 RepID=UPI003CF39401